MKVSTRRTSPRFVRDFLSSPVLFSDSARIYLRFLLLKIAELTASNTNQSSELQSLRTQLEDAKSDRSSAFDSNSELRDELHSVKQELEHLQHARATVAGMTMQFEEKSRVVHELTTKVEERDGLLATREGELDQLKRSLETQKAEVRTENLLPPCSPPRANASFPLRQASTQRASIRTSSAQTITSLHQQLETQKSVSEGTIDSLQSLLSARTQDLSLARSAQDSSSRRVVEVERSLVGLEELSRELGVARGRVRELEMQKGEAVQRGDDRLKVETEKVCVSFF